MKKSEAVPGLAPAALVEEVDAEEMDADELGLLFWGSLGEDRVLRFAEG